MTELLTGFFIDPATNTAEPRTIEHSLDAFYRLLNCSGIETVCRTVGTGHNIKPFVIVCDEEGALVEDPLISAISDVGDIMMVGPLFVVSEDVNTGELASLDGEDVTFIRRHVHHLKTYLHPGGWHMLTCCEYPHSDDVF